ncbi:MAG TPA: pseudouridine synthase [Acidimicrobiia bacterium]|nr:pseudouridine synthase [Acidimicrobiia bacterium]
MIAHSGIASRRSAEDLVKAGRVVVDGAPAHLGQKVDPDSALVLVDGVPLPVRPGLVHYLLNKPRGVVSTVEDPHAERTVVELVPADTRVYPVGRLDADSEGLIILTNDGDLTEAITHPSHGVTKTYLARVKGSPGVAALRNLIEGVELDDGPAHAVSARVIDRIGPETLVEVVMLEGRKRQVRRMLAAVGHDVVRLVRLAIGPIQDRSLRPGEWRPLTVEEVRDLYRAAGMG